MSGCGSLEEVHADGNELATVEMGIQPLLTWLTLDGNKLASLDVSYCGSLEELHAAGNELESIDLSNNNALVILSLNNNKLAQFPPIGASDLMQLGLSGNRLSSIDLAGYPYLYQLELASNELTVIDISQNSEIEWLAVENNRLADLDITGNAGLTGLSMQGNLMGKEQIDAVIHSLPDVTGVTIHEFNKAYARKLNISDMPGTSSADVASAVAKGWEVTADVADGIKVTDVKRDEPDGVYNLGGVRVGNGYKGIVISRGKKVVW